MGPSRGLAPSRSPAPSGSAMGPSRSGSYSTCSGRLRIAPCGASTTRPSRAAGSTGGARPSTAAAAAAVKALRYVDSNKREAAPPLSAGSDDVVGGCHAFGRSD
eukprot:426512-Pyramimonas_sp.AAC.1